MTLKPRFELREQADGGLHLSGYACVTGVPYQVGFFEETIAPGSFKRALNNPDLDVQLLVNHGGLPIARTTSGTLRLSEDAHGLKVAADLDPTDPDVQAIAPKLRRRDLTEMSMMFKVIEQQWNDAWDQRRITSVELHRGDVSLVGYGANDATTADIRARGTVGEAGESMANLPLLERRRRAEVIGKRATGGGRIDRIALVGACNRCGGDGNVTIPCPTCHAPATPRVRMPLPNSTTRARLAFQRLQERP